MLARKQATMVAAQSAEVAAPKYKPLESRQLRLKGTRADAQSEALRRVTVDATRCHNTSM